MCRNAGCRNFYQHKTDFVIFTDFTTSSMSGRTRSRHLHLPCPIIGCLRTFKSNRGQTNHVHACHANNNLTTHHDKSSDAASSSSDDDSASNNNDWAEPDYDQPPPPSPTPPPSHTQQKRIYHPHLTGEGIVLCLLKVTH